MKDLLHLLLLLLLLQPSTESLPRTRRAEVMARAERLATATWVCNRENVVADCMEGYDCDFRPGQTVTGLPYDWGGMDDEETFRAALARGDAAGSHSRHGITDCTAGIDCSGFVLYCWGFLPRAHIYSTRTIRDQIGMRPRYDVFSQMKPGDALNKEGSHIVLFAGYRPDGNPIVYEASGSQGRVIRNEKSTWARFADYYPMQYRGFIDP